MIWKQMWVCRCCVGASAEEKLRVQGVRWWRWRAWSQIHALFNCLMQQMTPVVPRDNYNSHGWCCQMLLEDNETANEFFHTMLFGPLCSLSLCAPKANQQIATVQLIWKWNLISMLMLISVNWFCCFSLLAPSMKSRWSVVHVKLSFHPFSHPSIHHLPP